MISKKATILIKQLFPNSRSDYRIPPTISKMEFFVTLVNG